MSDLKLKHLRALEILDSRGKPTVQVTATLSNDISATAHVPSGASTGVHEAMELRDKDAGRYAGMGVRDACRNVETKLLPLLRDQSVESQATLDQRMIDFDGTPQKSQVGANALLAVSCAVARAVAIARGLPMWQHLADGRNAILPVPMVNIFSGGLHAGHNIEFQDFLVIPHGFDTYAESLHAAVQVHRMAAVLLAEGGIPVRGVADEGGWGPALPSNEAALALLTRAIERAGYQPATQCSIAIDVASTHFYREGQYHLASEKRVVDSSGMIDLLKSWRQRFPVLSIEDGLHEDDWQGWKEMTTAFGRSVQLVGDDFFTTNPQRLQRGIREGCANAVLVKMNQIGTLTETFQVIDAARSAGFLAVISARSGETEDDFLADLAIASGMGQIKVGSIMRSERLAKYNRLLTLEAEGRLNWPGSSAFQSLR
jgi:enolase